MSNELADLLKTYNDKILAMEARIAFLEKLEASTSGSPPVGMMPIINPAMLNNLVLQNADGTLKDAGYGVSQTTATAGSVPRRDGSGTLQNVTTGVGTGIRGATDDGIGVRGDSDTGEGVRGDSDTGEGVLGNSSSGVGVAAGSSSGTGATSTSTSGTYHHEFGAVSAIARTSGVLTFVGGSAATNRGLQRTELGATTVGSNLFTAANPSAVTYIRVNADNSVSFLTAAQMQTALDYVTIGTTQTISGTKNFTANIGFNTPSPAAKIDITGGGIRAQSVAAGYAFRQYRNDGPNLFNLDNEGRLDGGARGYVQINDNLQVNAGKWARMGGGSLSFYGTGGNSAYIIHGAIFDGTTWSRAFNNYLSNILFVSSASNTSLFFQTTNASTGTPVFVNRIRMFADGTGANGGQFEIGSGAVPVGNLDINIQSASMVGEIIKLAASQTADALRVINSASAVIMYVDAAGVVQASGYKSSDGSTGWTGTFLNGSGATVTVKNGLITSVV